MSATPENRQNWALWAPKSIKKVFQKHTHKKQFKKYTQRPKRGAKLTLFGDHFGTNIHEKSASKTDPEKATQKVHPKTEKRCKVDPLWGPFWH